MHERRSDRNRRRGRGGLRHLAISAALLCASACSRKPRPNVILVTLDTTRADYLGAYGKAGDPTPNLDALAREGTRFDLAISSSAVTPVSHASILTGLENPEHGLRVLSAPSGYRLRGGIPTLATVLKDSGYRTGAVGSAFPVSSYFGFKNGFDSFQGVEGELSDGAEGKTWNVAELQRRSDATTELALEFLKSTTSPRFLWIHYWDPHDGVLLPPKDRLPKTLWRKGADGEPEPSRDLYQAEVSYVDAQFGRLVAALRERGEWDRTIVVVVADHGEGLGDHGWDHHRILYQEEIRVPLIVRAPGLRQQPSVADVVRTTDIYPTVLDVLGIALPKPVSGRSLLPLIEGRADAPRVAFADQINGYDKNARMAVEHPRYDFLYCALDREWKLIYRPTKPSASELFRLADDPLERTNLYASRPEESRRLLLELARYDGWVAEPFPPEKDPAGGSASAQSALNAIGYAGASDAPTGAPPRWVWICPNHPQDRSIERRPCATCGSKRVLVSATE